MMLTQTIYKCKSYGIKYKKILSKKLLSTIRYHIIYVYLRDYALKNAKLYPTSCKILSAKFILI